MSYERRHRSVPAPKTTGRLAGSPLAEMVLALLAIALLMLLFATRAGAAEGFKLLETGHQPSGSGNARTRTSKRPDSFVSYATHRPSGENSPIRSSKGVIATAMGARSSPVMGSAQRSDEV